MSPSNQQPNLSYEGATGRGRGGWSPHVCFLVFYGMMQVAGAVLSFILTLGIPQEYTFPFIANIISLAFSSTSCVGLAATIYYEWKGSDIWVTRVKNQMLGMIVHLLIEIAVNAIGTAANCHGQGMSHPPIDSQDDVARNASLVRAEALAAPRIVANMKYQTLTQQLDTANISIGWACTALGFIALYHFYYRAKQYQRQVSATNLDHSLALLREQSHSVTAARHVTPDIGAGDVEDGAESHALATMQSGGDIESGPNGTVTSATGVVSDDTSRVFGRTPQADQLGV